MLLSSAPNLAQEQVVQDPELELRFVKPKKWKLYDDTLNIYLLPAQPMDKPFSYSYDYMRITYFQAPASGFLDAYPEYSALNFDSYKSIEGYQKNGKMEVDNKLVDWVIYDSLNQSNPRRVIFFRYSKHGQDFQLTGVADKKDFSKYLRYFRKIARSFRTRRTKL